MNGGPVVVDTDVASAILAGRPGGQAYADRITGYTPALSFASVAELLAWAGERKWGRQRVADLEAYLDAEFVILPYRRRLAPVWADLVTTCRQRGYTPGQNDAWIAATAIHFECPVISGDRGFARMAGHYPALKVLP